MRIKYLIYITLTLSFAIGCNNSSTVVVPKDVTLYSPHKISCENIFVVGDRLVLINNSDRYFFDYYRLPNLVYIGSFGQLSRESNGFSMIPSPDLIKVISDTSFISDNRMISFSKLDNKVNISSGVDCSIINNTSLDSILNSKTTLKFNKYDRSDLIGDKIYSLFYTTEGDKKNIHADIPELHVFDKNYNLLKIYILSHPLLSFAISTKHNKIYTIAADNNNIIQVYDL